MSVSRVGNNLLVVTNRSRESSLDLNVNRYGEDLKKKLHDFKYIYPAFIYLQKQNNEQQLILPFATLHHDTALSN